MAPIDKILIPFGWILSLAGFLILVRVQQYRIDEDDPAFPAEHPNWAALRSSRYSEEATGSLRLARVLLALAGIIFLGVVLW